VVGAGPVRARRSRPGLFKRLDGPGIGPTGLQEGVFQRRPRLSFAHAWTPSRDIPRTHAPPAQAKSPRRPGAGPRARHQLGVMVSACPKSKAASRWRGRKILPRRWRSWSDSDLDRPDLAASLARAGPAPLPVGAQGALRCLVEGAVQSLPRRSAVSLPWKRPTMLSTFSDEPRDDFHTVMCRAGEPTLGQVPGTAN
jgi:hypothetical protein